MPTRSSNHEHEQLVSLLNQLMDERDLLARENEYLKAKINDSILVETVNEMKKERDLLLKLLTNLTNKYQHERDIHSTMSRQSHPTAVNYGHVHRLKTNLEQQQTRPIQHVEKCKDSLDRLSSTSSSSNTQLRPPQPTKRIFVLKTPQTLFRKPDIQLKHSLNSAFQHYRSQSLQNLA
ncbi:unnamed protein product [Adineta ricciae]|uniref:Uncharacterized protein n=1 Tax=Adineta ricciae TaxID=249248 RepID=A0A814V333_ADIRI|nr:unnamed protein product [Adineta ricciae]